ncbi:hypothetical protein C8R44DRAFT_857763 [Mycena epipterygia]|nr:hypothetical protein C8R44DRAFT_857763 [Mycena epipterygia]
MNYTVDPSRLDDYWYWTVSQSCGTSAEIFLYGILLVLFGVAGHLLYHRRNPARRILTTATAAMAVLATLQLAIRIRSSISVFQIFRLSIMGEIFGSSERATHAGDLAASLQTVEDFLLVTNNVVTDGLFIHRCFVIWGRNIKVVVVPVIMLLATTVLGYLCAYTNDYSSSVAYVDGQVPFAMSMVTNVVLMLLTAGRIWWIRRDACILVQSQCVRRYNIVIAIILESGAIYCASILLFLISVYLPPSLDPLYAVVRCSVPQIMNIAPTLIIVRVGFGYSVEETVSDNPRPPMPIASSPLASARFPSLVLDICPPSKVGTGSDIPLAHPDAAVTKSSMFPT